MDEKWMHTENPSMYRKSFEVPAIDRYLKSMFLTMLN